MDNKALRQTLTFFKYATDGKSKHWTLKTGTKGQFKYEKQWKDKTLKDKETAQKSKSNQMQSDKTIKTCSR